MTLLLETRRLLLLLRKSLLLLLMDVSCSSLEGSPKANGRGWVHNREAPGPLMQLGKDAPEATKTQ